MYIVGIAGGSGSGKTTFTEKVLHRLNDKRVAVLHQDSYYLNRIHPDLVVNGETNFDHPSAFDWELLRDHLVQLRAGKAVAMPVYDFKKNARAKESKPLGPCDALLVEGIFALWDESVRKLMNLKVFLNVDADIRFIRRLHRDVKERGRSLDSIIRQYYDTVRPMYHTYLEPTRSFADLIVGEETDLAADVLSAKIKQELDA